MKTLLKNGFTSIQFISGIKFKTVYKIEGNYGSNSKDFLVWITTDIGKGNVDTMNLDREVWEELKSQVDAFFNAEKDGLLKDKVL